MTHEPFTTTEVAIFEAALAGTPNLTIRGIPVTPSEADKIILRSVFGTLLPETKREIAEKTVLG